MECRTRVTAINLRQTLISMSAWIQNGQEHNWRAMALYCQFAKAFGGGDHCCLFTFIPIFTAAQWVYISFTQRVIQDAKCGNHLGNHRNHLLSLASTFLKLSGLFSITWWLLAFAILLVKFTLEKKYPGSICSWFSFSKNRTQGQGSRLGKKLLVKPFTTAQQPCLQQHLPASQHCFLLKKTKGPTNFWWGISNTKVISKDCPASTQGS